ncbi:unnamed protein product, partial [Owenia fusiformis]
AIWQSNYAYEVNERRDLHLASYTDQEKGPKECVEENFKLPCNKTPEQIVFGYLKKEIINTHNELLAKVTMEQETEDKLFTNFLQTLEENSGGKMRYFKTIVDVYYIPKSYWDQFYRLAEVFLQHKIYMEIAVPSILRGIEKNISDQPVTLLEGRQYARSKMVPILFKNKEWYSWHPFKLGKIQSGDNDTIQAYCSLFHGNWYRNPINIE